MRLYELAYCSHVFVVLSGEDGATAELRAATGRAIDPTKPAHAAALLTWLRRWGCRQFAVADEELSRASLAEWWRECRRMLPPPGRPLHELGDAQLDAVAAAYESLRARQASVQRLPLRTVVKTFGATGTAKALYAIRPDACALWDEPIRRKLGLAETGEGYRRHLDRVRAEIAEAAVDLGRGRDAADIPAALGRAGTSVVRLVDEHDWVRFTHGTEPPPRELLERWAGWAARA